MAFDTETTGLRPYHGDAPFAVSFCDAKGGTVYAQWEVDPKTRRSVMPKETREAVRAVLENDSIAKVGHNLAFDVRMMELGCDIRVRGRLHDTMFAAHVANTAEPTFALKPLSVKYLGVSREDQDRLKALVVRLRRVAKQKGWKLGEAVEEDYWMPAQLMPGNDLCEVYCVMDAERTMLLWLMYMDMFKRDALLRRAYAEEMSLWHVTYDMEKVGIRVDPAECRREIEVHRARLKEKEEELAVLAPGVNVNSPTQLAEWVYGPMQLPVAHRTAKGRPSVGRGVFEDWMGKGYPFIDALVKKRASEKAINFHERYLRFAVQDRKLGGWTIHPEFQQVGPVTGRFSCRNPNLQNTADAVKTRSIEPIQCRTPFGPRPGYRWYHFDYSQIEVIIFADFAQEETMLKAWHAREDLHTACANKAWGGVGNARGYAALAWALEWGSRVASMPEVERARRELGWKLGTTRDAMKVAAHVLDERFGGDIVKAEKWLGKKNSRAKAKLMLFTKIYGGGKRAIMNTLRCTEAEAIEFLADYDAAMPRIKQYIWERSNQARRDGYIVTRYGRKIMVDPDRAYRAVNYEVQGTAAGLLKRAMRRVALEYLPWVRKECGVDARMVLSVHDEIVLEVKVEHAYRWFLRGVKQLMEDHGGRFGVPFVVEVERTDVNWAVKKEVKL